MDEMTAYLTDVDILISSTGSDEYVITKETMEPMMARRGNRPLFMIDIAVPRDLDPALCEIPGIFLHDIDDLEVCIEVH